MAKAKKKRAKGKRAAKRAKPRKKNAGKVVIRKTTRKVTIRKTNPKKRRAKARSTPRRAKRANPKRKGPSGFDQLRDVVASVLKKNGGKPIHATAHPTPAYFKLPMSARANKIRSLARGKGRAKRAAVALARAERAHEGGPPRRRNPALDDTGALAEYEDKHWGERPRGIRRAAAPDPKHGTAVALGELRSVVYRTKKRGDGGTADYEHEFEGERPQLLYNDGGLLIAGGDYTVRRGGITG
jgi:hypothetical protein